MFTPRTLGMLTLAVTLATLSTSAAAQGRRGGMAPAHYDPATEVTVSGTVTDVQSHQGRMNRTGTHLMLDTASGAMEVHVGPTQWLASQQYTFEKGDAVTVVGSRTTIDGTEAFLARTITKGTTTYTLRNEQGLPKWAPAHGRRGTRQ